MTPPKTPRDLAVLYALAFPEARPWSADELETMIARPGGFLCQDPNGFAIGQALAGEAELITLAVHPDARRQGRARGLLHSFEATARARQANRAFLEVAEDNAPARALYLSAGWQEIGRRPRYYPRSTGAIDAVLMDKTL